MCPLKSQRTTIRAVMDPYEVEFLAENEELEVVPNFSQAKLYLISGEVGPFQAGLPVKVPLWLAIHLKQSKQCKIVAPEWMDVVQLGEQKDKEINEAYFTKMPSDYYLEITHILCNKASEDISNVDEVRTFVKDIWDLRVAKLRKSIDLFVKSQETHAKLNHLTLMEINSIRSFLTESLDFMYKLRSSVERPADTGSQDSQDV